MSIDSTIKSSLIRGISIAFAGFLLTYGMMHFKGPETIEIKGIGEQIIPADFASFSFIFRDEAPSFAEARSKSKESQAKVLSFLQAMGVQESEIKITSSAGQQEGSVGPDGVRLAGLFHIKIGVSIASARIDIVRKIAEKIFSLVDAGVMLGEAGWDGGKVNYELRNFDAIRPKLLQESIKSAQTLADKFFGDLGLRKGPVLKAAPGFFEVENDLEGTKKVRIITRVSYIVE